MRAEERHKEVGVAAPSVDRWALLPRRLQEMPPWEPTQVLVPGQQKGTVTDPEP